MSNNILAFKPPISKDSGLVLNPSELLELGNNNYFSYNQTFIRSRKNFLDDLDEILKDEEKMPETYSDFFVDLEGAIEEGNYNDFIDLYEKGNELFSGFGWSNLYSWFFLMRKPIFSSLENYLQLCGTKDLVDVFDLLEYKHVFMGDDREYVSSLFDLDRIFYVNNLIENSNSKQNFKSLVLGNVNAGLDFQNPYLFVKFNLDNFPISKSDTILYSPNILEEEIYKSWNTHNLQGGFLNSIEDKLNRSLSKKDKLSVYCLFKGKQVKIPAPNSSGLIRLVA